MDIVSRDAHFVCGKASKNLAAKLGALCLTTISILLWTRPSHSGQNATAAADVPYETKD